MLYEVITVVDRRKHISPARPENPHTLGRFPRDLVDSPERQCRLRLGPAAPETDVVTELLLYRRITSYNVCYTKLLRVHAVTM